MKLVTLDTIHWYLEEPEPTKAASRHDILVRHRKPVAYFFSFLIYSSFIYLLFGPSYSKLEDRRRKGLRQVAGNCEEEGGNGSVQTVHKEET